MVQFNQYRTKKKFDPIEIRASPRPKLKIRVSQVFWEPIEIRVSPRSALLEAAYLEALLYLFCVPEHNHIFILLLGMYNFVTAGLAYAAARLRRRLNQHTEE